MTTPHFDLGPTAPASAIEAAETAESMAKTTLVQSSLTWTDTIAQDADTLDAGLRNLLLAAFSAFTDRPDALALLRRAAEELAAAHIDSTYAAALDAAKENDDAP